jgi:ABC-2 type transport system permease protein
MNAVKRYIRIWLALVTNSFKTQMSTLLGSLGHLVGKFFRLFFFLFYILAIFKHVPTMKGYTVWQMVLFFMTFNIVDVGTQFLFRGIYAVKYLIEEGDFDKILTQPAHPLFRISVMGTDLMDLITLIPIGIVTFITLSRLPISPTSGQVVIYLLLLANAMLIAYAFHVFVATLSVRTQEMEGAIWIYRDVMTLGRYPVSIYSDFMRGFLSTVVPVAVLVSFPSEALLGVLGWKGVTYAFALGAAFYIGSQWFWRGSLREYTSISS